MGEASLRLSGAVFALILFAGAGAAAAETAKPIAITIGAVPSVPAASTYLALDEGYFRAAGFAVKIETIDSASKVIPYLASNQMQVVQGGISVGYFNALAQGLPIAMVLDNASSPLYHDLLVRPDLKDRIKTVADLKGRTVALVSPGAITTYELGKTLETAGLTIKDVTITYVPFTQMGAAFANKAIDVALEVPPFGDLLVEKGLAARWIDPDTLIRPTPMSLVAYMINTDWAKANPGPAQRLITALLRASRDYCQAYHHGPNRPQVVDTLVKHGAVTDKALLERMAWQARNVDGAFNMTSLIDIQSWFFRHHMIDKTVTADRLADESYAKAAVRQLGPFALINKGDRLAGCR